jgi:UDP-glucose 4-epimerase
VLPTFENDLRTTVNTLVAARGIGGPRVILTRSLDEPLPECPAAAPSSPYAAAKAASGLYGRLFQQLYSVPVVMLRPFMTYGPGQKDFKIVPYTIRTMLKGESPALSSGARQMDWVYVDDVIEAFIAAATVPDAVGAEIDLGSGSMTSIREVVEEIRALMPGAPAPTFGGVPDRANEQIRRADIKTAEERLGWTAKTSLRDGLRQTIDAFRA